jgi:hypothetical protein
LLPTRDKVNACAMFHMTKVMILFVQGGIFDIQPSCPSTYGYAL